MKTRSQLIHAGKVWQVYLAASPDDVLHEGSKTACIAFIRQKFGIGAYRRGTVRIGKLIFEIEK